MPTIGDATKDASICYVNYIITPSHDPWYVSYPIKYSDITSEESVNAITTLVCNVVKNLGFEGSDMHVRSEYDGATYAAKFCELMKETGPKIDILTGKQK